MARLHRVVPGHAGPLPRARVADRVRVMRLAVVAVLLVLVGRLVDVQVLRSGQYRALASRQLTVPVTIPALRGGIYTRDGRVLAMSVPTDDVIADDFLIRHPVQEALALAPMLGVPAGQLAGELRQPSGYVRVATQVPAATAQRVAARSFPGITLVADAMRVVPNGNLASPVLGFVDAAHRGAAGIEYQFNQLLAGRAGHETLYESPGGVVLPQSPGRGAAAVAGTGLELTIDGSLQYETEQALAAQMVATGARSGIAEVMDVRTGELLSVANLVATHPDPPAAPLPASPQAGPVDIGPSGPVDEAASNLAVTRLYEPGSVFKVVPFSAALDNGLITPATTFSVPDHITLDGSVFHDAEPHPTERLTAADILAQSSNIGTSEIALSVGEQRLPAEVRELGFGSTTGLHFPGESPGILAGAAGFVPTDMVSLPIGQVDAVTAQQVLDAYNAVAAGGVLVQPRLVRGTVGAGGEVRALPAPAARRVMSPGSAAALTSMLEQVVQQGTGTAAVVPGYTVAGKTGTAQMPTPGHDGYIPGAYMATFVGFAPADHPVLSAIVVLERPTPIFGGTVAAPVFSQIMGDALHRYDIPTTPGAPTRGQPASPPAATQRQDIT